MFPRQPGERQRLSTSVFNTIAQLEVLDLKPDNIVMSTRAGCASAPSSFLSAVAALRRESQIAYA